MLLWVFSDQTLHLGHKSSELYNHKANGDPSVLNCPQTDTEDDRPILCKEVEAAVQSLEKRKSAGVDIILAELVQADGEEVITAFMAISNKIWQPANPMDPVLSHHASQERQPAAVPELLNDKLHQPPKITEDHTEQTEATGGENHR